MRLFIVPIVIGFISAWFQAAHAQGKKFPADYSTPQKTYETYMRAILAKDLKAAIACHHFAGDHAAEALDVVVGMWVTAHELNEAVRAKFGRRGLAVLQEWNGIFRKDCTKEAIERTLKRVKAGNAEIKKEVAVLNVKWADDEPLTNDVFQYSGEGPLAQFKRVSGQWKIDLHAETGLDTPSDLFEKGTWGVMLRDSLAVERAVLPDILSGKLRSEEETIAAFEKRLEVVYDKYSPGWRKQAEKEKAAASIKAPVAIELPTDGFRSGWTNVPTIAVSERGVIYAFWLARGVAKAPAAGLPLLPAALGFSIHAKPEWSSGPGFHVFSEGKWSKPGLLLSGLHHASIAFAWCEGEDLHALVVDDGRERTHHVRYSPSTKTWTKKSELPYRLSSHYTAFRNVGKTVHAAFCNEGAFWYLAYDGKEWAKAVRLDAGGKVVSGGRMTHLAVTEQGAVHVAWWALLEPGGASHRHAVLQDGKVIYHDLRFKDAPIDEMNFDIGIDSKGRLMIAYKPALPEKHVGAKKIHVRCKDDQRWSEAQTIDGEAEHLFDEIMIIGNGKRTLVTWSQSESYPWRGGILGATFRRMATTDGQTWTPARWIARHPTLRGNGTPVDGSDLGACVDKKGGVHMLWGCCSYAMVANLNQQ